MEEFGLIPAYLSITHFCLQCVCINEGTLGIEVVHIPAQQNCSTDEPNKW